MEVPQIRPSVAVRATENFHGHPLRPVRVEGIDLKHGEQLMRRLALHHALLPTYRVPPPLSPDASPELTILLSDPAVFSTVLAPPIDPAWRAHEHAVRVSKPVDKIIAQSGVPPLRAERKRAQLVALLRVLAPLLEAKPDAAVVDFCAGCGHVGLLVAAIFPRTSVTLVDVREVPLRIARTRADTAGLRNIRTEQCTVADLPNTVGCDIAVALHACGAASDAVLAVATRRRAAVVVAPCCVGAVVSPHQGIPSANDGAGVDTPLLVSVKPQSVALAEAVTPNEFALLVRAADFGELEATNRDHWRGIAKMIVEHDRLVALRDGGYTHIALVKMRPEHCTPKNDVLVAWPPTFAFGPVSTESDWQIDHLTNGVLDDYRDASLLRGLGVHEVSAMENTLKSLVCNPDGPGLYASEPGGGRRARKIVHAVAESLNLTHHSVGRGASRQVIVSRHRFWPLFFDDYVGVGGPHVERMANSLTQFVPPDCVERKRFVRGSAHHLTIVNPREVSSLPVPFSMDKMACVEHCYNSLFGSHFRILGIGRATKVVDSLSAENKADAATYYAVVDWPAAQRLRQQLGLPSCDMHITLGFKEKDVHSVPKNKSTLIKTYDATCSPWILITK